MKPQDLTDHPKRLFTYKKDTLCKRSIRPKQPENIPQPPNHNPKHHR